MGKEAEVLAANAAFYEAFRRRDIAGMDELWSRASPVACIHPGWPVLRGRAQVMTSWIGILGGGAAPRIRESAAVATVLGGTAVVTCRESLPEGDLAATNVFVLEQGVWRILLHHASPAPWEGEPGAVPSGDGDDTLH